MNVLERARASGKCPPSLLRDEPKEDAVRKCSLVNFTRSNAILRSLFISKDLTLSSGMQLADDFKTLLQVG
jgi:hypothetical protein